MAGGWGGGGGGREGCRGGWSRGAGLLVLLILIHFCFLIIGGVSLVQTKTPRPFFSSHVKFCPVPVERIETN